MTRACAIAFLMLLATAGATRAQVLPALGTEDQPIKVDADQITYDHVVDVISASGNVVIQRDDLELIADEVRINRATNEAQARGNVHIRHSDGDVHGDAIDIDLDDETGFITAAQLNSTTYRYSLAGDLIEKKKGQIYRLENGRFTTCQCDGRRPDWSISGDELDVTVGGYGYLKGARFNILDVPVLYIPRALFPVHQERQSGFLRPRFGASNRRGLQAVVPFYWAINKSHDATIAFDVETNARLGALGEYRYELSRATRGTFRGSYFNELLRGRKELEREDDPEGDSRIPENRWSVGWDHEQPLLAGVEGYVDGFVVSDDGFLREINTFAFDYDRDVAWRTLPFTESRVGALRLWDRAMVKLESVYYQEIDLTGIVESSSGAGNPTPIPTPGATPGPSLESLTLQRAPELSLHSQSKIGMYLMGDFSAAAVNYQRGEAFDNEHAEGVDGLRLDLNPGLTLPLPLGRYAFGSIRGSVRETAYHLFEDVDSDGERKERNESRELFQIEAQIGTGLSRVYRFEHLGLQKINHTIEPIAEYLYVPDMGQSDLAFFDRIDRINARNLATVGAISRVLGKSAVSDAADVPGEGVRELGRLWLMQSVDFERRIAELDDFRDDEVRRHGASDHFSDLDFGGHLNPHRSLSLRFQSHFDTGDSRVSGTTVGLFVQDPREEDTDRRLVTRTSAGVSYRFLTQGILKEIDVNAVIGVTNWLGLFYAARYNLLTDMPGDGRRDGVVGFLDHHFGMRLISTCDCWAIDVGVTDRSNPNEIEARVQLTLVGLGSSDEQVAKAP